MGLDKNLLNIMWFGDLPRKYSRYVTGSQSDLSRIATSPHDLLIFHELYFLDNESAIREMLASDDYYVYTRTRGGQKITGCMTFNSEREFRLILFTEKKLLKTRDHFRIMARNHDVLNHVTTSAINLFDPELIMREFMDKVQAFLKTASWSLLLLNRERNSLYFKLTDQNMQESLKALEIPVGRGVAGWVASTREPIIINDVRKDSRFLHEVDMITGFETRRLMAAPLIGKGELFGVIEVINKEGGQSFNEEDLDSLKTLAKYGSIVLHNALLFKEMEEMTKRDDLTSLYNSRYQNHFLQASVTQATQYQGYLSIIFLDLDNFKSVNDNYGHLAGSSVLVDVAQLILEAVRPEDVVSRYGGDEFTVIQLGLTAQQSVQYAEQIMNHVRDYHYREIQLTVSVGIASFPEHGSTPEAILSKADKAMYKRKMNNKNGIEIAD